VRARETHRGPYPLEATENDFVRKEVGERVATVVGVVRGLLPMARFELAVGTG
jgi:hypothetical protein